MKIKRSEFSRLVMLLALQIITACATDPYYNVGLVNHQLSQGPMQRSIDIALWYPTFDSDELTPAGGAFRRAGFKENARPSPGKRPLVILSHGYSGDKWSLDWIAHALTRNGYAVVSLSHTGSTYSDMDPQYQLRPWLRVQDVSFVIDQLTGNQNLSPTALDLQKIGFIGFSEGGATGAFLAGATSKFSNMAKDFDCKGPYGLTASMREYARSMQIDYSKVNKPQRESRISSFILLAPGYPCKKDLIDFPPAQTPVTIIASEKDEVVANELYAKKWAQSSGAKYMEIKDAGHYDFLGEESEQSAKWLPKEMLKRSKRKRSDIHHEALEIILQDLKFTG